MLVTGDGGKDSPGQLVINSTSKSKTDFAALRVGIFPPNARPVPLVEVKAKLTEMCEQLSGLQGQFDRTSPPSPESLSSFLPRVMK